jgi:glutathionylspermidine synthase
MLVESWKNKKVEGTRYLLCGKEVEEQYHTFYMKSAAEKAGLTCIVISNLDELSWNADGDV